MAKDGINITDEPGGAIYTPEVDSNYELRELHASASADDQATPKVRSRLRTWAVLAGLNVSGLWSHWALMNIVGLIALLQ